MARSNLGVPCNWNSRMLNFFDTEVVVGSTTSIYGPLCTDHSCRGCWSDSLECVFGEDDNRFPGGAMAILRTVFVVSKLTPILGQKIAGRVARITLNDFWFLPHRNVVQSTKTSLRW